jgi:hypothetical protein
VFPDARNQQLKGEVKMKKLALVAVVLAVLLLALAPGTTSAGPGGQPPIKAGPVAIVGADDIGTCNNVWAQDSFNKFYTLTANLDGTYNLQVNYKDGTFVTKAGTSPGACESGPDNGSTVAVGVTGRMHQEWNIPVSATVTPDRNPDCGTNNALCPSANSFLDAVFGAGHYTRSPYSFTGHFEAGSNGTWFDTDVNWPSNDRGDITGSPK